jgi:hypothetical protein
MPVERFEWGILAGLPEESCLQLRGIWRFAGL